MNEFERLEEAEGRLAEMEIALRRLPPGSRAGVYMQKELGELLRECREHRDRWAALAERGEQLADRLGRKTAGEGHL